MGELTLAGLTDILNPDVTDGGPTGDAVIYYKARISSFANMQPVKVFLSIL